VENIENKWLELGNFIKKTREKRGWSAYYVCKISGFSDSYWSKIENGKRPNLNNEVLQQIAKILEINYLDLYKIVGYIDDKSAIEYVAKLKNPPKEADTEENCEESCETLPAFHLKHNLRRFYSPFKNYELENLDKKSFCPLFEHVAAGHGAINYGEQTGSRYVPEPYRRNGMRGFTVDGDSMLPEIKPGSIVYIVENPDISNYHVGVFVVNDEYFVKVICMDDNGITLLSINPDYKPIKIKPSDVFAVVGEVICVEEMTDDKKDKQD